ncbi:MAG: flavin reductase [Cereibacter sphaeroides]|uniref:Flavin reductase n=1 Tax=Cereibacter sphaeroides TaxID=1063 RepID=A0A2W5S4X2_CERSP|nr:MAG: flavin reductase [Cereibacter sphaeroides]
MADARVAEVPLNKSYRLLNHGPTVLVTTTDGIRRNVMAAAWSMAVDFDPPKISIVIDRPTLTRELIDATGRFGLTIPPAGAVDITNAVGQISGREVDKFARWGIKVLPDAPDVPPRLALGIAWLDCRVIAETDVQQRHDMFVAHVTAAWADPQVFREGHWIDGPESLRTIHHIAGGNFFAAGPLLRAKEPE